MPKIEHFDVPAEDIQRAKKFYESLFGWKIARAPGPVEYFSITTEEGDGVVQGGMSQRQGDQKIANYVGVDDIDKYINSVRKYGGKVLTPKLEIPGYGWLATFEDTEGNVMGLWQNT